MIAHSQRERQYNCYIENTVVRPYSMSHQGSSSIIVDMIEGDPFEILQLAVSVTNKHRKQHYIETFVAVYTKLDEERRRTVLDHFVQQYGFNHTNILDASLHFQNAFSLDKTNIICQHSWKTYSQAAMTLKQCSTPIYEMFLYSILQYTSKPTPFLIQMRLDLQKYTRQLSFDNVTAVQHPNVKEYNIKLDNLQRLHDFLCKHILPIHFAISQIEVRQITKNESPSVLRLLAEQEAVHPVESLEEYVRTRLTSPHKRVYAFFHRFAPNDPLVVLHASLQSKIPSTMKEINSNAPGTVATFYSISNIQPGLDGIGLGERLIHAAVKQLIQEKDTTTCIFATLSPIPGFRIWLEQKLETRSETELIHSCLDPSDVDFLCNTWECKSDQVLVHLLQSLRNATQPEQLEHQLKPLTNSLYQSLKRLAAYYIVHEKENGKPRNTVTRFHARNGAQVYRVNVAADLSATGWKNSFGVMVNYHYVLDTLQRNQERYEIDFSLSLHEQVYNLLPQSGRN